jgi:tetratricopeptide (TPR) repeat protein
VSYKELSNKNILVMRNTTFIEFFSVLLLSSLILGACESDLARRISKFEKTRDYNSAKKVLRRTIQGNPQNAEAHFLLGRIRMQQRNYRKGMASLKKSRELSARFVDEIEFLKEKYTHQEFKRGKEASTSGAFQKAIAHFRKVTRIQPSNSTGHLALGHAFAESGKTQQAEQAYKRAVKLKPSVEALNNLSALSFKRGAYSGAIRYSRQALDLDTEASSRARPELVKRLAYSHLQAGQFSKARERFREALQVDPSSELRRDFAFALYNRQKYKEALPLLKQLRSVQETDREVLHALGETYLSLDRPEKAEEVYLGLHQKNPQDKDALQSLVIAYQLMDREKKVSKYLDQLNSLSNESN